MADAALAGGDQQHHTRTGFWRRCCRSPRSIGVLALSAAILAACGGGSASNQASGGRLDSDGGGVTVSSGASGTGCAGPVTATATGWVEPIATDAQPQLPVTVTDLSGREVTVTDISRILAVDTYGTLATTVYALGLGDHLVGRDVSTGIPELQDLPLVTHNGHELNGEAILNLAPTVVLTDYSIGPLEVQLQLMDSGIPVVILDSERRRDQIGPQIHAVAEALGVPTQGDALAARTDAAVATAQSRVADLAAASSHEQLRMVFLYMRGNAGVYYWFGEGSGADDLIDALGGVDVATEVGLSGMRPLNAEGVVKAEPDLFLMMSDGLSSVGGVEGLRTVPGIAETNAGITGCVIDMNDAQILSFGPQFPFTLEALGEAIYQPAGNP